MSAPLARWNMTLTIGAERTIANPSEAQIESALHSLTDGGDAFAILASGEASYIQAAGSAAETFRLATAPNRSTITAPPTSISSRCSTPLLPIAAAILPSSTGSRGRGGLARCPGTAARFWCSR
jgi:hypothetical protein